MRERSIDQLPHLCSLAGRTESAIYGYALNVNQTHNLGTNSPIIPRLVARIQCTVFLVLFFFNNINRRNQNSIEDF